MKIINTLEEIENINQLNKYWNESILNYIYFLPKKVNMNLINDSLNDENYIQKLKNTLKFLKDNDVEKIIKEILHSFEFDTGYKLVDDKLYIIIGLDTTTIYSIKLDNKDITILCLESINGDMDNLKLLLAHEFTHFIRKKLLNKDIFESCIGERIVAEGIAANYSREIVSNKNDSEYCIVLSDTIDWVKQNMGFIEKYINDNLETSILMSDLFYMYVKIDSPVRTGYVFGYLVVRDYLEKNNKKIKDILGIKWEEILK